MSAFTSMIASVEAVLTTPGPWSMGAALVWGIFSVLLSPCNLVLIPMVISYIQSQPGKGVGSALLVSCAFSVGIFVNIAVVGGIMVSAGGFFGNMGTMATIILDLVVAAVLIAFGLHMTGVITIPWFPQQGIKAKGSGLWGALLLGLFSGLAIGPCTFAYLTPLLALAMKAAETSISYGIGLVAFYALGYCLVIILIGTFTHMLEKYLNWSEKSRAGKVISVVCGILIILGGLYFAHEAVMIILSLRSV